MTITQEDFEILPAGQAECNDFADSYVLVIDTKTPSRTFTGGVSTWLSKEGAESLKQQILAALNLKRKIEELIEDIDEEDITNRLSFRRYLQEELQTLLEESKRND